MKISIGTRVIKLSVVFLMLSIIMLIVNVMDVFLPLKPIHQLFYVISDLVDQVRDKLLAMPNLGRKSWGGKCESPLVIAVAKFRLDLVLSFQTKSFIFWQQREDLETWISFGNVTIII